MFGTCWSLIFSTALYTEMKNIWSAHMLYLGWLHKCMRLCNPDLRSYFSLFWSISYFVFNRFGQPAGWFPGGLSHCLTVGTGQPATTSLLCKDALCPPCFPSWAVAASANRPAVGAGGDPEVQGAFEAECWAHLLLGFLLSDSVGLAAGRAELITPSPQLQERLPVPWQEMMHLGEGVWWVATKGVQNRISDGLALIILFDDEWLKHAFHQALFSSWVRRFPLQSVCEKLDTGNGSGCPTGSSPGSRQLKIKFSSSSSVSSAFN